MFFDPTNTKVRKWTDNFCQYSSFWEKNCERVSEFQYFIYGILSCCVSCISVSAKFFCDLWHLKRREIVEKRRLGQILSSLSYCWWRQSELQRILGCHNIRLNIFYLCLKHNPLDPFDPSNHLFRQRLSRQSCWTNGDSQRHLLKEIITERSAKNKHFNLRWFSKTLKPLELSISDSMYINSFCMDLNL